MKKNSVINAAMRYVNKILLPLEDYYYHQYNHALDVMKRAEYLWRKEWLEEENIEILCLAALFHDSWFIIEYDNNEVFWARIASNYLKIILYPEEKIKIVEKLILATDPKYKKPKNILEKIIKDSDMDNLWREDFFDKWQKLKKELEIIKKIKIKDPDWHHSTLDLLYEHKFFTKYQLKERNKTKEINKIHLKDLIWKNKKVEFKDYSIEL